MTQALWNTAVWDYDRWPALVVSELLQQPPSTDRGVPIGIGDWKLSVEALLPDDVSALWGIGEWDTATWNVLQWQDLTPWVRGLEWTRGADEPYGRPRVGQLSVTLDSNEDRFSPWNPSPPLGAVAYFAPGTVVRVGVRSATDTRASGWIPQITAIVDTWGMTYADAQTADKFVDFVANETLRDLAQVDDNALPSAVGGGEGSAERIERLLDAAGWKYGLKVEAQQTATPTNYPVQSTDMTNNRLAECYLVADSCDAQFRTDRTGAALLCNVEYIGTVGTGDVDIWPLIDISYGEPLTGIKVPTIGFDWQSRTAANGKLQYVAYRPDTFRSSNTDDAIVNDARFTRAGGTQQVFEQLASIERHGRRTLVRNDLISTSDAVILQYAQYTTVRRALNTLRVDNLTINTSDEGDPAGLATIAADVGAFVFAYSPDGLEPPATRAYIYGFIRNMTHRITPRNSGSVTWETSIALDTRTVYNIPSAQLPSTQP